MGFLTAGDGPRLVALDAGRFARFAALPRRLPRAAWLELVAAAGGDEAVALAAGADVELGPEAADVVVEAAVEGSAAARWRGALCYGDLSRLLQGLALPDVDPAARAAWLELAGLFQRRPAEPWWFRARFEGSCEWALLDPPAVAALARPLVETGVAAAAARALAAAGPRLPAYGAADLPAIAAFLAEAAGRGDWVAAVEWS